MEVRWKGGRKWGGSVVEVTWEAESGMEMRQKWGGSEAEVGWKRWKWGMEVRWKCAEVRRKWGVEMKQKWGGSEVEGRQEVGWK